jgi:hypothetical protein
MLAAFDLSRRFDPNRQSVYGDFAVRLVHLDPDRLPA